MLGALAIAFTILASATPAYRRRPRVIHLEDRPSAGNPRADATGLARHDEPLACR